MHREVSSRWFHMHGSVNVSSLYFTCRRPSFGGWPVVSASADRSISSGHLELSMRRHIHELRLVGDVGLCQLQTWPWTKVIGEQKTNTCTNCRTSGHEPKTRTLSITPAHAPTSHESRQACTAAAGDVRFPLRHFPCIGADTQAARLSMITVCSCSRILTG